MREGSLSRAVPRGAGGRASAGWLGRRPLWQRLPMAAAAGAGLTLAQPPVSAPVALFLAVPAVVWLVVSARGPWGAAATGWAAGFGAFVSGLHWMGHAFLVDPDRFAWMMPFAVTLLPAGLALFWAVAAAAARALAPPAPAAAALVAALALATAELARSVLFTGLPWGLPAYAWIGTPVAQAAAWTGPHGLTLLTLAIAALPGVAGPRSPWAWGALAALGVLWGAGTLRLAEPLPERADAPVIRLVQPNAEQHLKWAEGHRERFEARLMALSAEPPGPLGPPDAVVWPEIAITFLPQDAPARVAEIAASARGATLLTGALFHAREDGVRRWSNALMAVSPEGRIVARYDKHHLVPFGEYMPFRRLLEAVGWQAIADMNGAGFQPGPGPRTLSVAGLPPFAPAICYEMIFPHQVIPAGDRPGWILHVTNDAWFGRFAGPQQHLAQARARAIEQGLPVLRAANTGISAAIDARGRVLEAIPLGTHGRLDATLPAALPPTLYARTGDWPALALIALGWALAARARRRRPA